MKIIGLIPARGGSKGIQKKSIALCAGKPLLAYTCDAALSSRNLSMTILSTDDPEIAEVGKHYGVEVPFLRPSELAKDDTPMIDVLKHAFHWLKNAREEVDAIALLQPTSPLRTAQHIDEAIELFQKTGANTVVSIIRVPHQFNPYSILKKNGNETLQPWIDDQPQMVLRQNKPALYARNGPAVLLIRSESIQKGILYSKKTFGYLMDEALSIDVDSPNDLTLAERAILSKDA